MGTDRQSHCPRGHELTADNRVYNGEDHKGNDITRCLKCQRMRGRYNYLKGILKKTNSMEKMESLDDFAYKYFKEKGWEKK